MPPGATAERPELISNLARQSATASTYSLPSLRARRQWLPIRWLPARSPRKPRLRGRKANAQALVRNRRSHRDDLDAKSKPRAASPVSKVLVSNSACTKRGVRSDLFVFRLFRWPGVDSSTGAASFSSFLAHRPCRPNRRARSGSRAFVPLMRVEPRIRHSVSCIPYGIALLDDPMQAHLPDNVEHSSEDCHDGEIKRRLLDLDPRHLDRHRRGHHGSRRIPRSCQ